MNSSISKYIQSHKNSLLVTAIIFTCGFMLFKGAVQIPQIKHNNAEILRIREQIDYEKVRQQETDELSQKVGTDEYIEKVAKEKLGLVKSNSKIFIDVSQENRK